MRDKRRWIFRKPTSQETVTQQTPVKATGNGAGAATDSATAAAEQRHAIAVATARASVQVARLTRPSNYARDHHYAAIVIQTAFRGYLVRKFSRSKISCRKSVELLGFHQFFLHS